MALGLLSLPSEILEEIVRWYLMRTLDDVVYYHWESRASLLLTCKRMHEVARPLLYEDVLLSSVKGFHCFFLCDAEGDPLDARSVGISPTPGLAEGIPWRDSQAAVARRKQDWRRVKKLTIDLNFSGSHVSWLSPPPICLAVPELVNTFNDPVTLQDISTNEKLLPNLAHLSERTTTACESYAVYYAHTNFRFRFYGAFSPRIFSVPQFADEYARWVHEPAIRFPLTLLASTEALLVRDFLDADQLFPLLEIKGPPRNQLHATSGEDLTRSSRLIQPVSTSLTSLYLVHDAFAYTTPEEDVKDYITTGIKRAFQQFPSLKTIHLPMPSAFYLTGLEADSSFIKEYIRVVEGLKTHEDKRMRDLKVLLDMDVWLCSSDNYGVRLFI